MQPTKRDEPTKEPKHQHQLDKETTNKRTIPKKTHNQGHPNQS